MYAITKTFGHDKGISCCFRQWKAESHCGYLHGYALSFSFTFRCAKLDHRNWVIDFGQFKKLEQAIRENFDHKTRIANDDPYREAIKHLPILDIIFCDKVGCEAFAERAALLTYTNVFSDDGEERELYLYSVTVAEHGGNSATFYPPKPSYVTSI